MIEFKVCLTKSDIKKFIIYNMGVKKFRSIFTLVLSFLLIIFFVLRGVIVTPSYLTFLKGFCFLVATAFSLYKGYSLYRSMFSKSGGLVEKERIFTINNRRIDIFCENDVEFCGRYFFYDLQRYHEDGVYIYLFFYGNIFIIIPCRCLTKKQHEYITLILNDIEAEKDREWD